ncbi:MAG: hypothetical protein ACR2KZ_08295 [Segetibacter sp.]
MLLPVFYAGGAVAGCYYHLQQKKKEWIGFRDIKKAVEVMVNFVQVWEEKS